MARPTHRMVWKTKSKEGSRHNIMAFFDGKFGLDGQLEKSFTKKDGTEVAGVDRVEVYLTDGTVLSSNDCFMSVYPENK